VDINWAIVINKDARGTGGYDLGEVQSVNSDRITTKKGLIEETISSCQKVWWTNTMDTYSGLG